MILRSVVRLLRFSLSMGLNQPESSNALIKIVVPPCVTAVLKVLPFSTGLNCPVWSLKLYTATSNF